MKYSILFFIVFLCFTWCIQNNPSIKPTQKQETQKSLSLSTWWNFDKNLSIKWLKGPIIILSGNLTFEWIFSVNIPLELNNWAYEKYIPNTTYNQNLSLWKYPNTQSLYITVWDSSLLKSSLTNKDICLLQTNYNWSPTEAKETIIKNIDNKEFFITRITFFTESNIDPYRYTYITHFCFIDDMIIYDMVLDSYPFDYANKIIDSFIFLK